MMVKDDGSDDTPISRGETDLVGRDAVYGMFGFRRYNVCLTSLSTLCSSTYFSGASCQKQSGGMYDKICKT